MRLDRGSLHRRFLGNGARRLPDCDMYVLRGPRELQRWLTLVAGLLLPTISLSVTVFAFDASGTAEEISDFVPALYFDGIVATGKGGHATFIVFAMKPMISGIGCLLLCIVLISRFIWRVVLPESTKANIRAGLSPIRSVCME